MNFNDEEKREYLDTLKRIADSLDEIKEGNRRLLREICPPSDKDTLINTLLYTNIEDEIRQMHADGMSDDEILKNEKVIIAIENLGIRGLISEMASEICKTIEDSSCEGHHHNNHHHSEHNK